MSTTIAVTSTKSVDMLTTIVHTSTTIVHISTTIVHTPTKLVDMSTTIASIRLSYSSIEPLTRFSPSSLRTKESTNFMATLNMIPTNFHPFTTATTPSVVSIDVLIKDSSCLFT